MTTYTFAQLITFTRSTAATYVNSSGLIASAAIDAPRFDYDPVTLAPRGFRVEEQRTNLLTYSEQFNNAAWGKASCTISTDAAVSPSGATNADKVVSANATAQTGIGQPFTSTATVYTSSFYVKADGAQFVQLLWSGTASTEYANFNLSAGTVTQSTGTARIMNAGNGWYRISLTSTLAAVTASAFCWMVNSGTVGRGPTYTGDGIKGFLVWGAQVEAGSFATTYIPTVASQVTRAADNAAVQAPNFSPWYNASEGTILAEFTPSSISGTRTVTAINDATANESIRIRTVSADPLFTVTDGGVDQVNIDAGTVVANTTYKIAAAYALNDFAVSINGAAAVSDTSGTLPTVTQLMLGNSAAANYLNGHLRSVRYYPTRLNNAQLQALTA